MQEKTLSPRASADRKVRRSARPAKQLLFMWLHHDMRASAGLREGLDVACAEMHFRPLFQTEAYCGIDIDAKRIETGLRHFPDASSEISAIEAMTRKGDFVLCVQTIGFNNYFDPANTLLAVDKLIEATRPGGSLIFNVGRPCQAYRSEIVARLATAFESVRARDYGAFNAELSYPLSKALAAMMNRIPSLRGNGFTYYVCANRV